MPTRSGLPGKRRIPCLLTDAAFPHRHQWPSTKGPAPGVPSHPTRWPAPLPAPLQGTCPPRCNPAGISPVSAARRGELTTPPLSHPESPGEALRVQIPGSRSFQSVFFRSSGSSARSTVLARTHASRNCICAFVWNQCSPPSITVRAAPMRRAKASTV